MTFTDGFQFGFGAALAMLTFLFLVFLVLAIRATLIVFFYERGRRIRGRTEDGRPVNEWRETANYLRRLMD